MQNQMSVDVGDFPIHEAAALGAAVMIGHAGTLAEKASKSSVKVSAKGLKTRFTPEHIQNKLIEAFKKGSTPSANSMALPQVLVETPGSDVAVAAAASAGSTDPATKGAVAESTAVDANEGSDPSAAPIEPRTPKTLFGYISQWKQQTYAFIRQYSYVESAVAVWALLCYFFVYRFILLRPYVFAFFAITYVTWFVTRCYVLQTADPHELLAVLAVRFLTAFQNTQIFLDQALIVILTWVYFLLPFLDDLSETICLYVIPPTERGLGFVSQEYFKLPLEDQWIGAGAVVSVVLLAQVAKHLRKLMTLKTPGKSFTQAVSMKGEFQKTFLSILFQLSFIIVGPAVWMLSGWCLENHVYGFTPFVLTFLPVCCTFVSMGLMGRNWGPKSAHVAFAYDNRLSEAAKHTDPSSDSDDNTLMGRSLPGDGSVPTTVHLSNLLSGLESCNKWLSYWSLWPLLTLIETAVVLQKNAGFAIIQEMQILLVFAVWCAWWGGSYMSILFAKVIDGIAKGMSFQGAAVSFADVTAKATAATGRASVGFTNLLMSSNSIINNPANPNQKYAIAASIGLFIMVIAYFFFALLQIISSVFTFGLWWYLAWDTCKVANENAKSIAELKASQKSVILQGTHRRFISMIELQMRSKLAFWIVNGMWVGVIINMPIIGAAVGVWTPVILLLSIVGGQTVGRSLVMIGAMLVARPRRIFKSLFGASSKRRRSTVAAAGGRTSVSLGADTTKSGRMSTTNVVGNGSSDVNSNIGPLGAPLLANGNDPPMKSECGATDFGSETPRN